MTTVHTEISFGPIIGNGHFGVVHRGTCPVHGTVAIKIMRQLSTESISDWKKRKTDLLVEAKHLAEASHNNVVRVYYASEAPTSDEVHLVMEHCSAGSFQDLFKKGPLTLVVILKAAHETCLGVEALHSRGKLHRDIKPGNLLRAANGRAKIGDFGLVTDQIMLGYADAAGYADHIAYEIWNGKGTSARSDIWALGMTIYRLLHGEEWYGRFPHPRNTIQIGNFANKLVWLPHIPKSWRRVLRKMMHDDTEARYQSANQVMSAFAKLSSDPDFTCEVDVDDVRWTRTEGSRRVNVTWTKSGASHYEWKAWSEPIKAGTGRVRKLGGSTRKISRSSSLRQLDAFFDSQLKR